MKNIFLVGAWIIMPYEFIKGLVTGKVYFSTGGRSFVFNIASQPTQYWWAMFFYFVMIICLIIACLPPSTAKKTKMKIKYKKQPLHEDFPASKIKRKKHYTNNNGNKSTEEKLNSNIENAKNVKSNEHTQMDKMSEQNDKSNKGNGNL